MTRRCLDFRVPLKESMAGDSVVPIWDGISLPAVCHLPGDDQRRQETETPAVSILK